MNRRDQNRSNSSKASEKSDLIVGRQAVLEALRLGEPFRVVLMDGLKGSIINEIDLLARQKKVAIKRLSRGRFEQLVGEISGSQGVAAIVPPYQYYSLNSLIALSQASGRLPFLIMLDHLEDPQNLGAVMRTADAAGAHGLIIPSERTAGITTAVRKVAAGAAERIPVARVVNLNRAAEALKKEGFWLYGAEADGDTAYYSADYCRPLVLVVGSEGKGLSPLLRRNCDLTLTIPMPGKAGSLNLSAAAAVLIYTALAQREGWLS